MALLKKTLLTAAALALGSTAPASAGGGHHHGWRGHGGYHHAYARHYRGGYYYGSRYYRHGHGHLSGGEAALIALGVVGGIVLIDRALERDRYETRYGYYDPPPPRDYYRRDDRPLSYGDDEEIDGGFYDDSELAGAGHAPSYAPGERRYNYGAAYNDCKAETRDAARDGGLVVALPAKPQRIEPIDGGAAVRFTAGYIVQDRGRETRRTMICEADGAGVRFLELV
ncbi:MAG: hypothetical protein AB7P23_06775 [Amphiplicatus sp.]